MPNPNGNPQNLRPPGFTDEQRAKSAATRKARADDKIAKYLKHLSEGKRIGQACEAAGLRRQDVYQRRKLDPEFVVAEKQAEEAASERVEDALYESAIGGNVPAINRWLEGRAPERWSPPKQVIETKQTLELEAGERIERIMALLARAEERKALKAGEPLDYIDVDPVD